MRRLRSIWLPEALGTFALVFAGTGAIVFNDLSHGAIGHVGIALTFGAVVAAMILVFGPASGAHLNPAVSASVWMVGRLRPGRALQYMVAQLAGALAASQLLHFLVPLHAGLGSTLPAAWLPPIAAVVIEATLTFVLVETILRTAMEQAAPTAYVATAVGLVVGLEAMFAGPATGASMNPFRSLAPAIVSGFMENLWVYAVGPLAGASVAALRHRGMK